MSTTEKERIYRVLEQFAETGLAESEGVQVTCLPENKTSTLEKVGEENRTVLLDEYRVDGRVFWAAYSLRSNTIFLSPVTKR
jgi:hypothetical protein